MRIHRNLSTIGTLAAATSLACVGGSLSITQRFAAIHNAVEPMGWSQVGPVSEGDLAQGESADIDMPLVAGGCYLISALGDRGVRDIDATLLDRDGTPVASESARSSQASLHVCASTAGTYRLRVTMAAGAGSFAAIAWTSAEQHGRGFGTVAAGGGTCDEPIDLELGTTVRGSTQGAANELTPLCIGMGQSMAPERVYTFEIDTRGSFVAMLHSEYDGALYLLSDCFDDPGVTVACNDDAERGDTGRSRVQAVIEPGRYFVVVDGYGQEAGSFSLATDFEPLRPIADVCGEMPELVAGVETTGATTDGGDDFQTDQECAAGSRAPDVGYRLRIDTPSRVRVRLDSDYDGVLAIRSDCAQAQSVIACNDDYGEGEASRRASQIVTRLEPGEYTVIVDGYEGEQGTFTLAATVVPEGAGAAPGDSCAAPLALEAGALGEADTFLATDDLRGSCTADPGGADVVFAVQVASRSLLTADVGGDLPDAVVYLQSACGDRATELACGTRTLSRVVDPGAYYLVVDGNRRDSFGRVTLTYALADVGPLEAVCSDAAILEHGRETTGRTSGSDRFRASCGGGARNPEAIYSMRIRERSRVVIEVEAEFDSVLYVRRDCVDPGSEVECNDDYGDANHSRLDLVLDAGTYYVFVDGFGEAAESGSFTIRADVSPQ